MPNDLDAVRARIESKRQTNMGFTYERVLAEQEAADELERVQLEAEEARLEAEGNAAKQMAKSSAIKDANKGTLEVAKATLARAKGNYTEPTPKAAIDPDYKAPVGTFAPVSEAPAVSEENVVPVTDTLVDENSETPHSSSRTTRKAR